MEQQLNINDMAEGLRAAAAANNNDRPLTILITGCSSGIGLYASKLLRLVNPQSRLILVAHNQAKADLTKKEVEAVLPSGGDNLVIAMVCDMSSLTSVREFAANLRQLVRPPPSAPASSSAGACGGELEQSNFILDGIDVVCLNAAVLVSGDDEPTFTEDGLEVTFQTNYLAPFLITNLIMDLINPGGRVVLTTSGLHIGPRFANFQGMIDSPPTSTTTTTTSTSEQPTKYFTMLDGSEYDYKRCYALSKLCITAFCLALNRRLQSRQQNIVVNCFSPGLLPTSGLFRYQKQTKIVPFYHHNNNNHHHHHGGAFVETVEWGGGALAWMAVSDEAGRRGGQFYRAPMGSSRKGGRYGHEFCASPLSKEACDPWNQKVLWSLSAQLAGIPSDDDWVE